MATQKQMQRAVNDTAHKLGETAQAMQEILLTLQAVKRKDDELTALRLECAAARQEIGAWKRMAIDYFDMLQRGIEQYGTEDARGKALLRDADIYARFCAARDFERITAVPGDPLLAELYQVIDEEASDTIPAGAILACVEWGYRSGHEVYKRARVIIAK